MTFRGLYAITCHDQVGTAQLLDDAEQALSCGLAMLQYRDKSQDHRKRLQEARKLAILCRHFRTPFVVNDDIELAANCSADGVHLGKEDGQIAEAKKLLGNDVIIGASCYNSYQRARLMRDAGASYLAFGRFFPSKSKPDAPPAHVDALHKASKLGLPLVAIGGVTPDNGAPLIEAGADMLAAIGGVFRSGDIPAACKSYQRLFTQD